LSYFILPRVAGRGTALLKQRGGRGVGLTASVTAACPLNRATARSPSPAALRYAVEENNYDAGGGRKMISCLAAIATTSGGFCSFMLWIAQNRS
jgi:hypothetical protein